MKKLNLTKETLRVLSDVQAVRVDGGLNDTIPDTTGTSVNCPATGVCNVSYNLCPGHTADCTYRYSKRLPAICDL